MKRLPRDKHLINLLATYELKNEYALIFPWADGNLRDFWQSKPQQDSAVLARWVAEQCLGIAHALRSLHNTIGHQTQEEKTWGRHGDIKPENILLFKDTKSTNSKLGTLAIADFGLSNFGSDKKRPKRLAGTKTYRPPEYDISDAPISRASDIWSLGCVFLEFLTWFLLGPKDVMNDFPSSRTQALLPGQDTAQEQSGIEEAQDDNFFLAQTQTNPVSFVLKPSVIQVSGVPCYSMPWKQQIK